MRCRLCGYEIHPRSLYCRDCTGMFWRWSEWAREQHRTTGRWPKVAVEFGPEGATIKVDSSGGFPDPNRFTDEPPKTLSSGDSVHIEVPQDGRRGGGTGLAMGTNADLAFYLRLKATPGCTSKLDPTGSVMHLYIEPNSEAARLFVSHIIKKLPAGSEPTPKMLGQAEKLLPGTGRRMLTDGTHSSD